MQNKLMCFSSTFLMLVLAWLTVCLPFVYEAQQELKVHLINTSTDVHHGIDNDNPLANTTEEKSQNSTSSIAEEYLHSAHLMEPGSVELNRQFTYAHTPIYVTFHGELISPPPDFS